MGALFGSSTIARAIPATVAAFAIALVTACNDDAVATRTGSAPKCPSYPGPILAVECDGGSVPGPAVRAFVSDAAVPVGCAVFPSLSDAAYATESCFCVAAAEAGCLLDPRNPMPYQWDCLPACTGVPF